MNWEKNNKNGKKVSKNVFIRMEFSILLCFYVLIFSIHVPFRSSYLCAIISKSDKRTCIERGKRVYFHEKHKKIPHDIVHIREYFEHFQQI